MKIEPFKMERMQSRFENYVDYNLSESGVHPMSVVELLGGADPATLLATELGYNQSNGSEELRDRIAGMYDGARRENVVATNGGSEANYATFWSLLDASDRVAYMVPNYLQTWGLARAFAGRADTFRLALRKGPDGARRWGLDEESLRRAVGPKTRLILVTNPNNPTGAVLTEGEMDAIVAAARRSGAWIVADEIYRGAEVSGPMTPSFWGRHDKVLITSGLSKAYGLPGLRIGWVVGPPKAIETIWSRRDYTTIAIGTLSDRLARVALEPSRREAIFARTRGIIRANLPVLESWIRGHGDLFDSIAPRAGAIAFLRYHLKIGSQALIDRLRLERSVLIVPGDQFGMAQHVRIGFGWDAGYLKAGLARIDPLLAGLRGGAAKPRRAPERRAAAAGAATARAAAMRKAGGPAATARASSR